MPMPARMRRSANCACHGAGTLMARTDAGPDGRSSETCRNSQVPSRLRREAGITGPSGRPLDGAPGAERRSLPMFSGKPAQPGGRELRATIHASAHICAGTKPPARPPGMQGANVGAEPARILIRLPELPMKASRRRAEPAVLLPRCLSNQHAARRPRTGTRGYCPGLSNPMRRPGRGRAAVPSSWC